jgi:putative radical SAM enzyme (TIGR03279 family)
VRITEVAPGSAAEAAGIRAGERLLGLNGQPVTDVLDYRFHAAADRLRAAVAGPDGDAREVVIANPGGGDAGLRLEEFRIRACRNRCLFCFVYQNPRGLRPGLYFKDEDYRLSFLHGHFVTLTNLSAADLERIVTQRLSPLYVSVHATDRGLRNRLLGNPSAPDVREPMGYLARHRITMHCQVVLIPGLNDGLQLDRTLEDLARLHPWAASVSLVPVGLTRHRERLTPLPPVTPAYARELLVGWLPPRQRAFRRRLGTRFAFAADELYLLAGRRFPGAAHYEDMPMSENGVGLTPTFIREFRRELRRAPSAPPGARLPGAPRRLLIVTGELAAPVLGPLVAEASAASGASAEVCAVPNRFFGPGITVAGLLTGQDIAAALQARRAAEPGRPPEAVLLPAACLKPGDGIFLDDWTPARVEEAVGATLHPVAPTGPALARALRAG